MLRQSYVTRGRDRKFIRFLCVRKEREKILSSGKDFVGKIIETNKIGKNKQNKLNKKISKN
jgi:hypothetical protein